jgi:hypothetical protein
MNDLKLRKGYVQISVMDQDGKISKQLIEGYQFEYEGIDFLVHKTHTNNGCWNVTECVTGMAIVMNKTTRKSALFDFNYTVNKHGMEKVKEVIKRSIEKYNLV